jgi:hypothetical protein
VRKLTRIQSWKDARLVLHEELFMNSDTGAHYTSSFT